MSLFDTGIRPLIDNHLLELSKEKRDYGDFWSASSAGYCMRKNIFERLGVPYVTEDAHKQRVFTSGHIFHQWIQELTKGTGASVAQEEELIDVNLMVKGHFDDLVVIDGTPILYDFKTAHSRSFDYAKDRPMNHYHRYQLGTYLYMLRHLQQEEVKPAWVDDLPLVEEARILKISKDDLRMHEDQLMWSEELCKQVMDYWIELNMWWNTRRMPPCTCADYEQNNKTGVGFMADKRYNPYYYDGEPCSLKWYQEWKAKTKQAEGET